MAAQGIELATAKPSASEVTRPNHSAMTLRSHAAVNPVLIDDLVDKVNWLVNQKRSSSKKGVNA